MPLRTGNRLVLLEKGAQYFPALIAEIEAAHQEILLESYIYADDATGRAVAEALVQAARRGVRVRVLLDGFGSRRFPDDVAATWSLAGVSLRFYRPEMARFRLRRHRLRRLHRKMVAIDGRVAFVGGINIIDDAHAAGHGGGAYDYALRIEGPILADIHRAMHSLWWLVSWSQVRRRPRLGVRVPVCSHRAGRQEAEFLQRSNLRHRREIEEAYLAAIRGAKREILIANAYFLPGRHFRHALVAAAKRGVRVRLLLQGRTDHHLYQIAARALYRFFLENDVEIHEYHVSFLHAKAAVVDDAWATVGSSNIDPFSLLLAREANVAVHDREFTRELRDSLNRALEVGAHPIHRWGGQSFPWYQRLASWVSYGFVRLAMSVLGLSARE